MSEDVKMSDAKEIDYPRTELAQLRFEYGQKKDPNVMQRIMEIITEDRALVYYQKMCESLGSKPDAKLCDAFQQEMDSELKKYDAKLEDARENLGDVEVKNALLDKAELYCRTGDKEKALKLYAEAKEKTVGTGGRLDNTLVCIRIGLFWDDLSVAKENIATAWAELEKGGDWERRNKLKVYEGLYRITQRDFKGAAELFLASVATFTAVEIISFKDFAWYTTLCAMIGVDRATLKKKVIDSPEILSVLHEKPHMREFLFTYYECDYRPFMRHFAGVIDHTRDTRVFSPHLQKITREVRVNTYKQFVSSYKSVTIKSMADTFGVRPEFIAEEMYLFISTGKLPCKIDNAAAVIEMQDDRHCRKTQLYKEIIKEGDNLLNKMQKMAAAIER